MAVAAVLVLQAVVDDDDGAGSPRATQRCATRTWDGARFDDAVTVG